MTDINPALDIIAVVDTDDLNRIVDAVNARNRAIRAQRAANAAGRIAIGQTVRTDGLKPKYLNGLVGKVVAVRGSRADLELTTKYADALVGTKHGPMPYSPSPFVLTGLPLVTLTPIEQEVNA